MRRRGRFGFPLVISNTHRFFNRALRVVKSLKYYRSFGILHSINSFYYSYC